MSAERSERQAERASNNSDTTDTQRVLSSSCIAAQATYAKVRVPLRTQGKMRRNSASRATGYESDEKLDLLGEGGMAREGR